MESEKLLQMQYSPGYCDMRGAIHWELLEKTDAGEWQFVTNDRETIGEPEVITTYEVLPEAVEQFEAFIKDRQIVQLENRKESDLFVTDYSPWSYRIMLGDESDKRKKIRSCCITEYKSYSDRDLVLISELRERFRSLRGKKISETKR